MHRAIRLLAAGLACLVATACSSPAAGDVTISAPPSTAVQRDYWPTSGWRTANPAEHGMDPSLLAELDARARDDFPQVNSMLVVRHGYLVYEHYWNGFTAKDGHDVRSVTKSVVSALVGIALRDGHLQSLDQTVQQLLAQHLPADADPKLRGVTLKQLLTMTSGLAGDDPSIGGDEAIWSRMAMSPDWVAHILGRQIENEPGERFAYSNATAHLLSAIVADATDQSTLAYARAELFGPLGIASDNAVELNLEWPVPAAESEAYERAPVAWQTDPQGYHFGAAGLKLPSRDLAKLGYLYLNGGRWDGTQIVPADYVRDSISAHSDPGENQHYGYQWWVTHGPDHDTFRAQGFGGQFVLVVPDFDLVVVATSDPTAKDGAGAVHLIQEQVIPAVIG